MMLKYRFIGLAFAGMTLAACGGGGGLATREPALNTSVVPISSLPYQAATAAITGASEDIASSLNPANQFTQLSFTPGDADRVTLQAAVPVGFDLVSVDASFGRVDIVFEDERSVLYRQTAADGTVTQLSLVRPENPIDNLSYASFGYWLVDDPALPGLTQTHFAYGVLSTPEQLAITGTASYRGLTEGHLLEEDQQRSFLAGSIALEADFDRRSIRGAITDLRAKNNITGIETSLPALEFNGRMVAGENRFQGSLTTEDASLSGDLLGQFYGPSATGEAPPEVAGGWRFGRTGAQAVGAFAAGRRDE